MGWQRTERILCELQVHRHTRSVAREGRTHTGSTQPGDGSQAGRKSRMGVDEGHTPPLRRAGEGYSARCTHVAPPPMCMSHLLREQCARSTEAMSSDNHRFTNERSRLHCLQSRPVATEACDSSLRGAHESSYAIEPTLCHP